MRHAICPDAVPSFGDSIRAFSGPANSGFTLGGPSTCASDSTFYPLLIALSLLPSRSVAQTTTWNVGDVFIADGSSYQVWRNGALLETFSGAWGQAGGCAFDAQFNLYGTYGVSSTVRRGNRIQWRCPQSG